jgi:predicted HNH restriction endonuclease
MSERISEKQLILPSLYLMSIDEKKSATTTQLINKLEVILKPQGEDLAILNGRKDTKFSQKVRNLKAHDTFIKYGNLATYKSDGTFTISPQGIEMLNQNFDFLKSVISNDFKWDDTKEVLGEFANSVKKKRKFSYIDEDTLIKEGYKKQLNAIVYERSKKLRDAAFEHYKSSDGHICCDSCKFDFKLFYGKIGDGFIELHHTKPVFMYEDEDLNKKIDLAISNLTPVCSNCHRMIHRNWSKPLAVQDLINNINQFGTFNWAKR